MKIRNNIRIGELGEKIASEYLQSQGYKILERNFRKRYGDIDIIAVENGTLVFIEVKTRVGNRYGLPEESITPWKIQNLIKSSYFYKLKHPRLPDSLRIDVVSVLLDESEVTKDIKLIKNITL